MSNRIVHPDTLRHSLDVKEHGEQLNDDFETEEIVLLFLSQTVPQAKGTAWRSGRISALVRLKMKERHASHFL